MLRRCFAPHPSLAATNITENVTLAGGRRTPILFTSTAARRNSSLIAHGELLGDVALRLMLQRIAYPDHPPCELYLDIPGEPTKTSRRNKKGTKT